MSYLETEDTIAKHYDSYRITDSLAFDDWPEEQRRIARAVVKHELDSDDDGEHATEVAEAREDGKTEGIDEATATMEGKYSLVTEIHAEIATQVRAIRANPPADLDGACKDILAQIADLPDKLDE